MATKKYMLPPFGELNLDFLEEYYDAEIKYNGQTVHIDLNFDDTTITEGELIGVKSNLESISSVIDMASKAVESDFFAGETTMDYIEHHLEDIPKDELSEILKNCDKTLSPELQLLSILKLYRIGFYPGKDNAMVMDFTIGKSITDYLVVVNLNEEGIVDDIVMES